MFLARSSLLLALCVCTPSPSRAIEGGVTAFPNGGEDFLVAHMPPPGVYGLLYYTRYTADRLADGAGRMPVHRFDLEVNAFTARLDWVKPVSCLGADRWGTLFVLPQLDLNLALEPAPGVALHGARFGPGDLTIGNGFHWTFPRFEMINSFDVSFPTGRYDARALVNPGLNRWVGRLNHMGSWHPLPAWDVSYRLHTDLNRENPKTNYTSGQTVYLNWAIGWQPQPALTVGLTGYNLRQVTDDRQNGHRAGPDGQRVRVDAFGLGAKYFLPSHAVLTAKYYRERSARNHPRGEQFWLYVAVPLSARR